MANYLVTGGAGFIGGHLVRRLLDDGHSVRVIDNLSTGKRDNLADLLEKSETIDFIEGDITDVAAVGDACKDIDYVLHQAALPSVPRSISDPVATDKNNVHGTLRVLNAARAAKVKRVVQASSSSVYGDTPTLPKVETMPLAPKSPYACSKAADELYGKAFYSTYGLEYVALRYFNVFGPRQDPKSQYAAVLPRFITAYLKNEPPTVYGDGEQSRDFCYIDNVVQANLLACRAKDAPGQVFNVACNERISLLQVLDLLAEHFGKRLEPTFDPARAGDVKHSLADIDRAKTTLGYQPTIRFPEGLGHTIEWFAERG